MSQKDKLVKRFLSLPNDFTYSETVTLMKYFGFVEKNNDGSRRAFYHPQTMQVVFLHEPHPGNIMKKYALHDIKQALEEGGYL